MKIQAQVERNQNLGLFRRLFLKESVSKSGQAYLKSTLLNLKIQ